MNQTDSPFGQHQPGTSSDEQQASTLREAAARRLRRLTAPGGWLDQRRRELTAAINDWSSAEHWVRTVTYTVALALGLLILGTAGGILLQAAAAAIGAVHLPEHIPGTGDGLATTITHPVHAYLASHTPAPLTEASAYGVWKTFGLAAGALACFSQAATWRLAWTGWSVVTVTMVWSGTDPAGRTVAVGITAAALAAASALALRGISFSLRPLVINRTEVQPQITVQAPAPQPSPGPVRLTSLPNPSGPFDQRH
ncbi:hypothetical protein ABZW30_13240 [Kitasatospora sp. NPDC004669]|uniref:hypothetical protein n=1 Tax=Kitasatospora sp. NPDC004669 TaxID=3154555 RepID=UPI0033AF586E